MDDVITIAGNGYRSHLYNTKLGSLLAKLGGIFYTKKGKLIKNFVLSRY